LGHLLLWTPLLVVCPSGSGNAKGAVNFILAD
jgi:hypothetical protein